MVWKPRKHKHGGCNWVPMMCRIVASLPDLGFGGPIQGLCRTAANYANRPGTRRNSTSAANLDPQGAKPLTNWGISTCFRSGRLMAFCKITARQSTCVDWKTFSLDGRKNHLRKSGEQVVGRLARRLGDDGMSREKQHSLSRKPEVFWRHPALRHIGDVFCLAA